MSEFDELLAQLTAAQEEQSTLAKALPEAGGKDDKTIQTAAADGADGDKPNPEDLEEEENDGKTMTKSILVDGESVDVVDAEVLIKSLNDLTVRADTSEGVLAKGLTAVIDLVKGQNTLIKSLQDSVTKLSGQGTGRKTVLTIAEKPNLGDQTLAKSQPTDIMSLRGEIMAKANSAFDARKISGQELTSIDVAFRNGVVPDQALLAKCL